MACLRSGIISLSDFRDSLSCVNKKSLTTHSVQTVYSALANVIPTLDFVGVHLANNNLYNLLARVDVKNTFYRRVVVILR